jgi:hypothetical protein
MFDSIIGQKLYNALPNKLTEEHGVYIHVIDEEEFDLISGYNEYICWLYFSDETPGTNTEKLQK